MNTTRHHRDENEDEDERSRSDAHVKVLHRDGRRDPRCAFWTEEREELSRIDGTGEERSTFVVVHGACEHVVRATPT